ncbi:MAG TPA: hypothetical protein VE133_18490, partial [Candidatus Sulfotelmatobacter sp.]|nr:hypothetical protein [Candidatus Sulfotelmatobacter sp.]
HRTVQPVAPPPPPGYAGNETVEVQAEVPAGDTSSGQLRGRAGKDTLVEAKFSPELLVIYRCATAHEVSATSNGCKVPAGQLKVTIDLTQADAAVERKLKSAGFQQISGSGTKLVGMIAPARPKQLAQVAEVKSVSLTK